MPDQAPGQLIDADLCIPGGCSGAVDELGHRLAVGAGRAQLDSEHQLPAEQVAQMGLQRVASLTDEQPVPEYQRPRPVPQGGTERARYQLGAPGPAGVEACHRRRGRPAMPGHDQPWMTRVRKDQVLVAIRRCPAALGDAEQRLGRRRPQQRDDLVQIVATVGSVLLPGSRRGHARPSGRLSCCWASRYLSFRQSKA